MYGVNNESLLSLKLPLGNCNRLCSSPQLLMCGTGDINVQDFKAHAVIVGGSWHFREKVSLRDWVSRSRQDSDVGV